MFCLKTEVTSTVFSSFVSCNPTDVCSSLTLQFSQRHVVALVYFLVSLFCFVFPNGQSASLCPGLPVCQSLYSQYWQNHFTKERKKKEISQLFLTVAQYRSVVYCSITLSLCCCFSSHISGGNKSEIVNIHVLSLVKKEKRKKNVSFDRLVVHIWINIILKTVSCNIGV